MVTDAESIRFKCSQKGNGADRFKTYYTIDFSNFSHYNDLLFVWVLSMTLSDICDSEDTKYDFLPWLGNYTIGMLLGSRLWLGLVVGDRMHPLLLRSLNRPVRSADWDNLAQVYYELSSAQT